MKNLSGSVGCLVFLALFASGGAVAEKAEIAPKRDRLEKIESRVEAEKSRQAELQTKAQTLETDMKGLKTRLIEATSAVQKQERGLQEIETKLEELRLQKDERETALAGQRQSMAGLVLALERIRRLPPETLIARPDAPLETARAATVMATIVPELDRRARVLKEDLAQLAALEEDLTEQKSALECQSSVLKADREKMDKLADDRSRMLAETKKKLSAKSAEIASLSKEAKSFRDLIEKLEKRNRDAEREGERDRNNAKNNIGDGAGPALGTGRVPVSGIIKTRYGESDDIGATCKGLIFQARPSSIVVSPLDGVVRYAGEFRTYGNIVLIEHKNKFHSLVAGLGKIDTFVGQRVDAGEPLGSLPSDKGRLYYELRYRGDPVNPSKKFTKLN